MTRYVLSSFIVLFLFVIGCKDDVVTPTPQIEGIALSYPLNSGDSGEFQIDSLDEAGAATSLGTRYFSVAGSTVQNGTSYLQRNDSTILPYGSFSLSSLHRKTDRGVYIFVDTTALTPIVPDSLRSLLIVDGEITYLALPFYTQTGWSVYKIIVGTLSLVDFQGQYQSTENLSLTLNGISKTISAKKVLYTARVSIPETATTFLTQNYKASAWFADSLGLVKIEGNAPLIGLFTGGTVELGDTVTLRRETLTKINVQ